APPPGRRSRIRFLRPRRLARSARRHPRHRREPRLGDSRLQRRPGPPPARRRAGRLRGRHALRGGGAGRDRGGADMKAFADLYTALDETNRTSGKVEALARYFSHTPAADAAWAVYFLVGRKPRQAVSSNRLWDWAVEASGLRDWLFEECYHAVGDIAETVT